jgi:DNA-binding NarL/FixJ family response regulator
LLHAFSHYLALRFEHYAQGASTGMLLPAPCENTILAMQPAGVPMLGEPLAVPLTRRELLVLRLLAQGLGNRQIAEQLERDVDTIEKHVKNIRRKLGVQAVTDAVAIARQRCLLAPE